MRRGNARTLACAAAAAAGLSLFGAGAAQAQRPEKLGDGIKTGQLGVQMFNYGGYISNGGNTGAANPITGVLGRLRDVDDDGVPARAAREPVQVPPVGGRDQHRAVRPRRFPGEHRHRGSAGLPRADGQVRPPRRRLARLHERGPVGHARRRREDPRRRLHRLGRRRRSGHRHLRRHARQRPGAQPHGQEGGRGRRRPRVHPQPHGRVRPQVRRGRGHQDGVRGDHGQHRPALRRRGARRVLVLGRPRRRHGHRVRGDHQQVPDRASSCSTSRTA